MVAQAPSDLDALIARNFPTGGSIDAIRRASILTEAMVGLRTGGQAFGRVGERDAPRARGCEVILERWILTLEPAGKQAYLDACMSLDPNLEAHARAFISLQPPTPAPPPPVRASEGGPCERPAAEVQRQWVQRLEATLAKLESRIDARGVVTDKEWADTIRAEHEWIESDEVIVVLRGPAIPEAELDQLEASLEGRNLFLPADYRAFLSRYAGLWVWACASEDIPGADERTKETQGLISEPEDAEFPDEICDRLIFFDNVELGYFAFEFGERFRLLDQSGEWGGIPNDQSRTLMAHVCFADWLTDYLEAGFSTFSYMPEG